MRFVYALKSGNILKDSEDMLVRTSRDVHGHCVMPPAYQWYSPSLQILTHRNAHSILPTHRAQLSFFVAVGRKLAMGLEF